VIGPLLTIFKLKRWSINYYIDTATTAERMTAALQRRNGGLGEYYSEHENQGPVWLLAEDSHATRDGRTIGCPAVRGGADSAAVARWLDDGVAPNGAGGRTRRAGGARPSWVAFNSRYLMLPPPGNSMPSKTVRSQGKTRQRGE
jgi:hypothetical protein